MPHPNQLRLHRKKWALSQRQLATLLDLPARSLISQHELGVCSPGLRAALAYEFVFGVSLAELFHRHAREVEDAVMRGAARLDHELEARSDNGARRTRELLHSLINRSANEADA